MLTAQEYETEINCDLQNADGCARLHDDRILRVWVSLVSAIVNALMLIAGEIREHR